MPPEADSILDASGLVCPMPLLKTSKAIEGLRRGQILQLIATDPGSLSDVPAWARRTGNELVRHGAENGRFIFFIRKA